MEKQLRRVPFHQFCSALVLQGAAEFIFLFTKFLCCYIKGKDVHLLELYG